MKRIVVRYKYGKEKVNYIQLTSVCDINAQFEVESPEDVEAFGVINSIIKERGINSSGDIDGIASLMEGYSNIQKEMGSTTYTISPGVKLVLDNVYDKAKLSRADILEVKRKNMIEALSEYGEVWLNSIGGYCTPLKGYEIIESYDI